MTADHALIRPSGERSPRSERIHLPVQKPPIYGYQFYGFPLAIQMPDSRTHDWMLSNFVNLDYDIRGQDSDVPLAFYIFDYAQSPWLEFARMDRTWFAGSPASDVVINALDQGFHVYTFLDEFHVPNRERYQVQYFPHDVLVHGYDNATEEFELLGFDARLSFRTTAISRSQFDLAYDALDGTELEGKAMSTAPVIFWRLRSMPEYGYQPTAFNLDLELIEQSIDEYLRGVSSAENFRALRTPREVIAGIEIYQPLAEYMDGYFQGRHRWDIRHLHVLWEHKHMMVRRLRRLVEPVPAVESLIPIAEELEGRAQSVRNAMLRDRLVQGRSPLRDTWRQALDDIATAERPLLEKLLSALAQRTVT